MKYVAYYRVSTTKQGQSGLGLEAQRNTVQAYAKEAPLLAEYAEVESGKSNKRPQLLAAIAHAKKEGAVLVIAKLDRLSRNVAFIATLMETGVNFVACDLPEATPFTLHIMAALAEQERKLISSRTKAALDVLKSKGVRLGTPANLTEQARQQGLEVRQLNALENDHNRKATALILARRGQGISYHQIARELNAAGFQASRGGTFNQKQVQRLYERATTTPADFKFKVSEGAAPVDVPTEAPADPAKPKFNKGTVAALAELDTALKELAGPNQHSTPECLCAAAFIRECLVQMPISGPFPNEWTTWCYARRSNTAVFSQHENLRETAREQGLDAYQLAGRISSFCGALHYFHLGGEMTAADRHLAKKMENEMGSDWVKLPSTLITPEDRGRKA